MQLQKSVCPVRPTFDRNSYLLSTLELHAGSSLIIAAMISFHVCFFCLLFVFGLLMMFLETQCGNRCLCFHLKPGAYLGGTRNDYRVRVQRSMNNAKKWRWHLIGSVAEGCALTALVCHVSSCAVVFPVCLENASTSCGHHYTLYASPFHHIEAGLAGHNDRSAHGFPSPMMPRT